MSMGVLPLQKIYEIRYYCKTPPAQGNKKEGNLGVKTGW